MTKPLVAMSGGVDSAVSLLLSGSRCGVTLSLFGGNDADIQNSKDARAVCERVGAEHFTVDASEAFTEYVRDYFVSEYLAGRTPNPCIVCNRDIKLNILIAEAKKRGFDSVATGHYARKAVYGDYTYIKRAADLSKDQSYVLARITYDQLCAAQFPLGEMTKAEVRETAARNGFESASRRDSQDICFIPDGDYAAYIEKCTGIIPSPGNYTDEDGKILGKHKGYIHYTIGQRKGLGISMGRHIFVLGKDSESNTVTLGDEDRLYRTEVRINSLHTPTPDGALDGTLECEAKLRYAHKPSKAVFIRTGEDEGILKFEEPQRAPTPGQFAVIYTDDCVRGSGVIE